ncbi:MAG: spore germination protein [Lachnospiraceae bacterium]|nr:spore germination protein [Lachnospiraceae bacterium]
MYTHIFETLSGNKAYIKNVFKDCDDIVTREMLIGVNNAFKLFMVYTDNIASNKIIEESIMTNLMTRSEVFVHNEERLLDVIKSEIIAVGEVKKEEFFENIITSVLLGDTVIFSDKSKKALVISTRGWPTRGVGKTETEVVVQGPKDAFTEAASINTVLIRRRIRDSRLKVNRKKIGVRSKTDIAIMYMEDLVRPEILNDVKNRIYSLNVDALFDAGYMGQLIERDHLSPFPQVQLTERPDKAASAILEGRVVVVVDNSPFVMVLPATLNVFFQSAEDYYERWEIMSLVRIIRYGAAALAVVLPGLYIALMIYHPEMIPTALALKIAASREAVPFPTVVEVVIMEIEFELLREAGVRLPGPIGSTMGIVGGIIIGQAAVEAGLVSPAVIIISALTGICTFVIPNTQLVSGLRLSKYFIILMSAALGLFGLWIGVLGILIHLSSLKSFNVAYLSPYASAEINGYADLKDTIIRLPLFMMKKRPVFTRENADKRMGG